MAHDPSRRPIRLLVAALAGFALLLSACEASVSTGEKVISKSEVEEQAAAELAAATDQPEPDISCPDDLEAEVGATMDCELSVEGDTERYPVTVEVTAINDGKAEFDVEVGEEPLQD